MYSAFDASGTVSMDGVTNATLRYVPSYPQWMSVHDPCLQLRREQEYAPGYTIVAYNFACPGAPLVP